MKPSLHERIRLDKLRPPNNRGVLAYLRRKLHPRPPIPDHALSIFINRYCNLDCYSCYALGMHPTPDETTLDDIGAFLRLTRRWRPGAAVQLTGGEPTLIDPQKLRAICDAVHGVGRIVGLLTNGARLHPVEWFDYVRLDDHGVNRGDLAPWRNALTQRRRLFEVYPKTYHQDTLHAMDGNVTKGARCTNWLRPITLWKSVVYPCCNAMCLEWWHHTEAITEALRGAGWTVQNPDLYETMTQWRETLPAAFYRLCTLGCWKDATKAMWRPIDAGPI